MTGKVKVVNSRGFGFIETADGIDYFFHHSVFSGDWKKLVNDFLNATDKGVRIEVSFVRDLAATEGPKAIDVRLV